MCSIGGPAAAALGRDDGWLADGGGGGIASALGVHRSNWRTNDLEAWPRAAVGVFSTLIAAVPALGAPGPPPVPYAA